MTKEVLKLALEALEDCYSTGDYNEYQFYDEDLVNAAKEALREALAEQPAQQEPSIRFNTQEVLDKAKADRGKPVTPVEYKPVIGDAGAECNIEIEARLFPPKGAGKITFHESAQRTWVGLTDVEWMNIVNKDQAWFGQRPDEVAHEVAKLVEAKLKEKNQ